MGGNFLVSISSHILIYMGYVTRILESFNKKNISKCLLIILYNFHVIFNNMKLYNIIFNKMKNNKCLICSKKVGLYGFICKCNECFCSKHMLPENHVCNFDFKSSAKEILIKQNPQIRKNKVIEI